ncbi:MAG: cobalamin biosynthesis protein CobD [Desulfuromonadales bacterium]|nr:cobalamin biosynthesis protein CobD [Desulfuromonadales bacterium]
MIWPDPAVLALALLLDLTLGDPHWLPHPVVMIGRLISALENLLRKTMHNQRIAGVLLLFLTVTCAASTSWCALWVSSLIHPLFGLLVAALLSSTCLAARSLQRESALVADALDAGDIVKARVKLAYIVGRDTEHLDEPEIWRALIETVAENTTDGIIAPLFWLALGGPVAGMAFKAISTLDSMVGYKNERYLQLGWASARMDDLVNLIPARLTALLMIIAAPLIGLSFRNAATITLRDRLNHPSPNSAHPESAAAGALGIRLGGPSTYGGRESVKQFIGDPLQPIDGRAYRSMIRLMFAATLIMAVISLGAVAFLRGFHVTHL